MSQILNFGLPAPIDIQIAGLNRQANFEMASEIARRIRQICGVDGRLITRSCNVPKLHVDVDQTRARHGIYL